MKKIPALLKMHHLCTLLLLGFAPVAYAAVPVGVVMTDFGGYDLATATAIQTDGKIVVVGDTFAPSGYDAALARYLPDGRLDATFGTGGKVTLDLAGCPCNEEVHAVLIQPDGKIVIGGSAVPGASGVGTHFVIARFNANGTVDTGFGVNGKVFINLGGYYEYAYALTIQSDGKIVAAGDSDGDFALTRVTRNGRLDTSFGVGGKVRTDFAGATDEAHGVVIQADGKIVAGGFAGLATGAAFAMTRYTSSGVLDSSFGSSGKVTGDNIVTVIGALSMAQQSDGKLILAGSASPNNIALLRFFSNGAIDSSFGNAGKVTSVEGAAKSVAVQSDGKIVVGGYTRTAGFAVLRFDSAGLAGNSFGVGGIVTTDINPPEYFSGLYNLAVQSDNKIVAVGIVQHNSLTHADFGVVRYGSNGVLDSTFGARADLAVSMTDSPDPVLAGDNLTYTITVSNTGTDAAQAVEIGGIPSNSTFVSATSSLGICSGAVCKIGTLAGGVSATVTLVVNPYLNGTLTHSVTVNSTTADGNSANNSATTSTAVNGSADLAVSMTDSPDPVKIGQNLTYTVTIQNVGTGAASQVVLTDVLPPSYYASYVSTTTSQGSCNVLADTPYSGMSTLRCALGQVNAGATATVNIVLAPSTTNAALQNSVEVKSLGDSNPANNVATTETMVGDYADLGVTLSSSSSTATTGQQVTYTVQVNNAGPDATSARVSLNLPFYTRVVSVTSAQATCGSDFVCTTTLASGASVTVTAILEFTITGDLTVSAHVSSTDAAADLNYSNNSVYNFISVTGQADLAVSLTSSVAQVAVGTPMSYTVTVTNNGPNDSGPVRALLALPGMAISSFYASNNSGCDGYFSIYDANLCGNLKPGSVWTVTYSVTYSGTGSGLTQLSLQRYYGTDPVSSNDTAQLATTVTGSADLAVSMSGPTTATVNGTATYTVVVNNLGTDAASNVVLSGFVPQGYSLVSSTTNQGYCNDPIYYPDPIYFPGFGCSLYDMPSGSSSTVTVVVKPLTRRITITPSVTATSQVTDPNSANNTASSSTYIK